MFLGSSGNSESNKAVKAFVAVLLTRTLSTPRLLGHGFAILPDQALHAERRLPGR